MRVKHAVRAVALAVGSLGMCGSVHAFIIDTGNPDLAVRFDNTVRYTIGTRVEARDDKIARVSSGDEGNAKFDRGDIVTNRFDVLSEFDLVWKRDHGFRVSAAGWYDHAYRDSSVRGYNGSTLTSYRGNEYSGYTDRYYHGPSGEILDAFMFTRFDIGDVPTRLRLGRHTITWGEGFLHGAHAVSFAQSPSDGAKGAANPGSETKELAMPVGQLSFQTQLTDNLSLAGQYFYEWKPTRIPEGGTFLGSTDFIGSGPNQMPISAADIRPRAKDLEPDDAGSWGVSLRYVSDLLGANLGFYYRELDERTGWVQSVGGTNGFYRVIYPQDVKLYGLSVGKEIASASVGFDLSYRKNAGLNSGLGVGQTEGARGNTWHATLGAQWGFSQNPVFDSATLIADVAYSRLAKVTDNKHLFRAEGYAGCTANLVDKSGGCSTKEVWLFGMRFMPQWQQVLPGVDITLPIAYTLGLKGNGATLGGGNEGAESYSVGVQVNVNNKHEIVLQYADSHADYEHNGIIATRGNGSYTLNDRGRVTLTYKVAF